MADILDYTECPADRERMPQARALPAEEAGYVRSSAAMGIASWKPTMEAKNVFRVAVLLLQVLN